MTTSNSGYIYIMLFNLHSAFNPWTHRIYIHIMLFNLHSAFKSMNSQNVRLVKYIHLTNVHMYEVQSAFHNIVRRMILPFFTHSKLLLLPSIFNSVSTYAVLLKTFFLLSNKSACLALITHYFTELPIIMPWGKKR